MKKFNSSDQHIQRYFSYKVNYTTWIHRAAIKLPSAEGTSDLLYLTDNKRKLELKLHNMLEVFKAPLFLTILALLCPRWRIKVTETLSISV